MGEWASADRESPAFTENSPRNPGKGIDSQCIVNDDSFTEPPFSFTGVEAMNFVTQELATASKAERTALSRTLDQRMEWAEVSRIERLESALRVARGRLRWNNSGITAKVS
jgi:hypothetical protein